MSNWVKYAGFPFGDRVNVGSDGKSNHDFKLGDGGKGSFTISEQRHGRWKLKRKEIKGYADENHSFRHQGSGDINLYKLFLEQAYALLRQYGRFGLIVPSGIYSDFGTIELRQLFIEHCQWDWLFSFENRKKIFNIHSSYKFNPVILTKGSETRVIRTAFMRHNLADWEKAEQFTIDYPRQQINQFSPNSRAILEIQSERDLEILSKVYSNSVLLGDQSEAGWGIKYSTEFHMTNDSKLFPPRPKWEEWGYRPDEYSRWIKGPWKNIDVLYSELGIKPLQEGERRCAQPPYDRLPILRADIPEGIILSREADAWLHEDDIPIVTFTDASGKPLKIKKENLAGKKVDVEVTGPAVALPLYQGVMIWQLDFSFSAYVSGAGNRSQWSRIPWDNKIVHPQFLLGMELMRGINNEASRWIFRDISNATNQRSFISALISNMPTSNTTPTLKPKDGLISSIGLIGISSTLIFDWNVRCRMSGTHLNYYIIEELPLMPSHEMSETIIIYTAKLNCPPPLFASTLIKLKERKTDMLKKFDRNALTDHERLRIQSSLNAMVAYLIGIDFGDYIQVMDGCDYPIN